MNAQLQKSYYDAINEIIKTNLDVNIISEEDDFFQVGGDSMSLVLFAKDIEKEFGIKLPLSIVINTRIIGEIIEKIIKLIHEKKAL